MKVLQILTKGHRKNSLSWWSRTSVKPWEDGASLKGLPLPTHTGVWTLARPVCWEETSPYYNEMIAVENSAKQRTVLLKSKNILRTSSACTETTFLIGMSSLWISYPSKKKSMLFWNSGILPRKQAETSVCSSPDRAPWGSREAGPLIMDTWWVPMGTNAILFVSILTQSWLPLSCCKDAQVKLSTKNCRDSCALHHPSHLPVFHSSYLSFFHSGWARTQRWQAKDKDLSFDKLLDLMPVMLPLTH